MDMRKRGTIKGKPHVVKSVDGLPRRRQLVTEARRPERVPLRPQQLPPPPALKQKKDSTKQPTAAKQTPRQARRTVEINIILPSMKKWKRPLISDVRRSVAKVPRKTKLIGGTMMAITLVTLGGYYWLNGNSTTNATDPNSLEASFNLERGTPKYPTVMPAGKTAESLGGWTRISPKDRNPVYAYVDKIGNTSINVSQQPLPENFLADTAAKVEQLAINFKANEKVTIGSMDVHIGTSANGPQSVIFYKDTTLVLIKSTNKIDTNQWTQYINSLK